MPIDLEKSESLSLLRLQGSVDIESASELKQQLLDALGAGRDVSVCLADVTALDVTAVQLLWRAESEAARQGVGFSMSGPVCQQVTDTLAEAGLESYLMTADHSS